MNRVSKVILGAAVAVGMLAESALAQDEAGCIVGRYNAAARYASCEAKQAGRGNGGFFLGAELKCRQQYAASWSKLKSKFPGTSCDTATRYEDNGDGTITDHLTQLVWEKKDAFDGTPVLCPGGVTCGNPHDTDNLYTWSADANLRADGSAFTDFLNQLNSTGFAGHHDWRLPTIYELHTMVAYDAMSPCTATPCLADPVFQPTRSIPYSSTTEGQVTGPGTLPEHHVWTVSFQDGITAVGIKTNLHALRAVRAGS